MIPKHITKALAFFLFVALVLASPPPAPAAGGVSVKLIPAVSGYPAGRTTPLLLMMRLPAGAKLPPGQEPPLEVALGPAAGVKAERARVVVPPSMPGVAVFILEMKVAAEAKPGPRELSGVVALNLPGAEPRRTPFQVRLEVLPQGEEPKVVSREMLAALLRQGGRAAAPPSSPAAETPTQGKSLWETMRGVVSAAVSGKGGLNLKGLPLWMVLLLALGTGLVLNATPCVYPLIPITISYFGGRSQGRRGMLAGQVLAYWAGMALMYSGLGALAALSGRMLGEALTNPLVLVLLAAVFVALATSMFGFWEIRMPSRLTQAAAANRAGLAGTFLMGLLVGVLAAPCVGPVVVAFIALVAQVGEVAYGLAVFFALAVGLGLPLSILAFFSGSISRLPGAGDWMVWVRAFFGVTLVIMAWFVLRPLVPPQAFFWVLAFICLASGVYLGFVKRAGGPAFRVFSRLAGIALILAPALFWWLGGLTPTPAGGVEWTHYSQAAVDKAAGKPKLVLFTADWCPPCRRLKAYTFPDPRVQEAMGGFVTLKADMTTGGDAEAQRAARKWVVRGVPTMVFLDQKGRPLPEFRVVGFIPPASLVDRLNTVLRQIGARGGAGVAPPGGG